MALTYWTICDSCGAREEGWPANGRVHSGWARVENENGEPRDLCPKCWTYNNAKPMQEAQQAVAAKS